MSQAGAFPVALLNRSSAMTDDQARIIMTALQVQASSHFRKVWGLDARMNFVPRVQTKTGWQHRWNLVMLDTSDEANALGYHDITPDGLPLGKVFVKTTLMHGGLPSVTASHELLEMLLDPYINDSSEDPTRRIFVAKEACDSVEADEHGYDISLTNPGAATVQTKVRVSDFVTPEFFDPTAAGRPNERYCYRDLPGHEHSRPTPLLARPFQLAKGGYEAVYVPGRGWTQYTNFNLAPDSPRSPMAYARAAPFTEAAEGQAPLIGWPIDRPMVGSRRERRRAQSESGPDALVRSVR